MQAENTHHIDNLGDDIRPEIRVGISVGEVVVADNTVTGAGVVLAQRLEPLAAPGAVAVQGAVAEAVPNRLPFDFDSLGEQILKGFDQPSIVVRPFTNMSSEPEQEYFNEDVITDLSKGPGLFVIARNSAFAYKDKASNVADACRELDVRFALEGSVLKAGNRVRITASWSTEPAADTCGQSAMTAVSPTSSRSRTKSHARSSALSRSR